VLKQDLVLREGLHFQMGTVKKQPHPRDRFQCLVTFPGGETGVLTLSEETVRAYPDYFEVRESE
jgi:hypothetical protein